MADNLINLWLPVPVLVLHQALGKALEECNELGSALSRALIQGFFESEPVTEKRNRDKIREEIADVLAVLDWLAEISTDLVTRGSPRYVRKIEGFRRWQQMLESHQSHPSAVDDLKKYWAAFCDCDPFDGSDTFAERMEIAGLIWLVPVTPEALQSAFASERGLEPGGMMYELTPEGNIVLGVPPHG